MGAAWLGLSLEQAQAWRDYAESLQRVDLDTGALVGPRAQTLFSKLSLKFLQVNPTGEIPLTPPDSEFAGDGIGVMVGSVGAECAREPLPRFHAAERSENEGGVGEGDSGSYSPLPTPSSLTNQNEEGAQNSLRPQSSIVNPQSSIETGIRFTPTGPNSAGVVTELLVQPLASIHRAAYRDKYRPVAYFAFAGESYAAELPPGPYATAYRFIRAATGQESALFECGLVVVGA